MRAHHYRRNKETPDIDVTTFLNLMVVLIPFLLVTAVFSRVTIMELNLPTGSSGAANKPQVTVEVIVRKNVLQIADGRSVTLSIPKVGDKYDLKKLSEYLQRIKATYVDKQDATVLLEPDIDYEDMIHVMDAVRVAEIKQPGQELAQKLALFPAISVGEAP